MRNHDHCSNKYKCDEINFNPLELNKKDLIEAICFGCDHFSEMKVIRNKYYKPKNMKDHIERHHFVKSVNPNYFGLINDEAIPKEE